MGFLVFLLSLAIAFAPILIFFIVAKLMIQFIKNQKEYKKAQGYKDASFMNSRNKNSRTSRDKKKLSFDELKNFIEENKDKLEKNFEKLENKKEEPVVFDKDFQTHVSNYYKELRDKGYSKKEAYKMIKDSKDKAKGKKTEFEKFIKKEMAYNKKEEIEKKDKSIIELLDNDLVKECESDHVDYHDENSNREFLAFDEEDFVKYQIYKEIFDKPLSIR